MTTSHPWLRGTRCHTAAGRRFPEDRFYAKGDDYDNVVGSAQTTRSCSARRGLPKVKCSEVRWKRGRRRRTCVVSRKHMTSRLGSNNGSGYDSGAAACRYFWSPRCVRRRVEGVLVFRLRVVSPAADSQSL